jgi:hypothetical protein
MSASPTEDESQQAVAHIPSDFGLHRGRRVLAGCLVAGLLILGGQALYRAGSQSSEAPAPAAAIVAPSAKPAVALRPAPLKRKSKSARSSALRATAIVEHEPALSAPPLVPAAVEVERHRTDVEAGEAVAAAAPPAPQAEVAPAEVAAASPVAAIAGEAPHMAELAELAEPEAERSVPSERLVEVGGEGNGEAIGRAIAADKRAAVQACFERELKQTPTLKGTLTVELNLAPPHRVDGVRVTDDLERPAFTQCVTSTMEHLRFAELNEEVSVLVPYVLSARAK